MARGDRARQRQQGEGLAQLDGAAAARGHAVPAAIALRHVNDDPATQALGRVLDVADGTPGAGRRSFSEGACAAYYRYHRTRE